MNKTPKEAFEDAKREANYRYHREIRSVENSERIFDGYMKDLRENGIVLIDHGNADRLAAAYHFDLYKVCAEKCKAWGRPYIKCVALSYKRIVVSTEGERNKSLLANLLLTAEPLVPIKEMNKNHKFVVREPDFVEQKFIPYSVAPVRSYVTPRTVTLLFEGSLGVEQYNEWASFVTTDRMHRLYLGLK